MSCSNRRKIKHLEKTHSRSHTTAKYSTWYLQLCGMWYFDPTTAWGVSRFVGIETSYSRNSSSQHQGNSFVQEEMASRLHHLVSDQEVKTSQSKGCKNAENVWNGFSKTPWELPGRYTSNTGAWCWFVSRRGLGRSSWQVIWMDTNFIFGWAWSHLPMTSDKLKNWNENVYKLRGRRDKGKNGLESKGRPSGLDSVDISK